MSCAKHVHYYGLKLIYYMMKLFGLAPFSIEFNKKSLKFTSSNHVYTMYCIVLTVFLFFNGVIDFSKPIYWIINVHIHYVCIILQFIYRNKLINTFSPELHIAKCTPNIYNMPQLILVLFSFLIIILLVLSIYYFGFDYCAAIMFVNFFGNTLPILFLTLIVYLLYTRLDHLILSNFKNKPSRKTIVETFEEYSQIWITLRSTNSCSNLIITLTIGVTFLNGVQILFMWLVDDRKYVPVHLMIFLLWFSVNVLRVVAFAVICNHLKQKSMELAAITNRMILKSDYKDDNNILFSLQLEHEKADFWACGLFIVNNNLIYSILGTIMLYSILIFQIKAI